MIIQATNNLHLNAPKTYLSTGIAAGATTSPVKNTTGLTTSWGIQIGEIGEEQSEVLIGTNASGTSITHPATSFEHPADTPVYFTKYNQVVFERSTAGTSGTATPMTSGTITYQADRLVTEFDDTSGSASYAYRTYFRNSTLNVTTIESDWITSAGFAFYSLAKLRERTKGKLWNANFVTDDQIDEWSNEWKETLRREAIAVNEDYSLGTVNVAFGTDGLGTITASDYKGMIQRLWVTYDGVGTYRAHKMDITSFLPDQTFSSVNPYYALRGDSVFLIKPEESGGTAHIVYPTLEVPMDSDTDELPVYMRDYTKSFVDYNLIQAQYKDGKISLTEKISLENALKSNFKSDITPRKRNEPTYVELVENISGEDYSQW